MRTIQGTLFLLVLFLLMILTLPTWPYSLEWGYFPSGGFAFVLLAVLIVVVLGRRRRLTR